MVRVTDKFNMVLNRWELTSQRNALLDGITLPRAAATAARKPEYFEPLVQTLYLEQVCKSRRSIAPEGRGQMTGAAKVLRGIILRHALYPYLRQTCPKLSDSIANFGRWQWFHEVYGMTETGRLAAALPHDSDEAPDTPSKGICPRSEEPSRFASKVNLIKLRTMVARCKR